ncbi:MAG: hypothetical protein AAGD01_07425 [Acidobacteriota bacterium]
MIHPTLFHTPREDLAVGDLSLPLQLDDLLPARGEGESPWEVELGFGKGRYLHRRAGECPDTRFLGVELVSKYCRMLVHRGRRDGRDNLVAVRGEALYLLSAVLPRGFAQRAHVYHPDPWPKARHHKRRLFDPERVDLVLSLLAPGGELCFATDFLEYGEIVAGILESQPGLRVERLRDGWPEGPRTHYEAKFVRLGQPILRIVARLEEGVSAAPLHPQGRDGILAAVAPREEAEDAEQGVEEG